VFGGQRRVKGTTVRVLSEQDMLDQRATRTAADRQAVDDIRVIRTSANEVVRPILAKMFAARDQAKLMAERTHDKMSLLRRALGPFAGEGGIQKAMEARATYRTILRDVEPIELTKWAQQCIDGADPLSLIIADCVLRENFTRPRDNRPFMKSGVT
jgi:hypothetical protein